MEPNEITAGILKRVCKALGLKTYEMAEQLGIGRQQMYDYTSGKYPPKWEFWNSLLKRFPNVSADFLLTGEGEPLKA